MDDSKIYNGFIKHKEDKCIKKLGDGSIGSVQLYEQSDGTYYTVKKLKRTKHNAYMFEEDETITNYLNNEYNIGTLLNDHPYIRQTLGCNSISNELYLEYIAGIDFFDYIFEMKNKDDKLDHYFYYYKQCIEGLSYMHDKGIAHMDIKLENLIIDVPTKTLKIIDLGVARFFKKDQYFIDHIGMYGTTAYMAPEQFTQRYNPDKVDIWSCGILFYELVYFSTPWDVARKKDDNYSDYYYFFTTYDKLLPKLFSQKKYNELFYKTLHPNPNNRCTMSHILRLIEDLTRQ